MHHVGRKHGPQMSPEWLPQASSCIPCESQTLGKEQSCGRGASPKRRQTGRRSELGRWTMPGAALCALQRRPLQRAQMVLWHHHCIRESIWNGITQRLRCEAACDSGARIGGMGGGDAPCTPPCPPFKLDCLCRRPCTFSQPLLGTFRLARAAQERALDFTCSPTRLVAPARAQPLGQPIWH